MDCYLENSPICGFFGPESSAFLANGGIKWDFENEEAAGVSNEILALGKCTMRPVLIVVRRVKFPSSPQQESRCTAGTATLSASHDFNG